MNEAVKRWVQRILLALPEAVFFIWIIRDYKPFSVEWLLMVGVCLFCLAAYIFVLCWQDKDEAEERRKSEANTRDQ